jgi:uncharacterized protein (TIGR02611 family)
MTVRRICRQLKSGEPGRRFRDFHDWRQKRRKDGFSLERILVLGAGFILLVGGLAIGVLPGPGGFVSIFGAALLATEFPPLARLLDWTEVRARQAADALQIFWRRSSLTLRIAAVAALVLVVAATAWLAVTIVL